MPFESFHPHLIALFRRRPSRVDIRKDHFFLRPYSPTDNAIIRRLECIHYSRDALYVHRH